MMLTGGCHERAGYSLAKAQRAQRVTKKKLGGLGVFARGKRDDRQDASRQGAKGFGEGGVQRAYGV